MARIPDNDKAVGNLILASDFTVLKNGVNDLYPISQAITNTITFDKNAYAETVAVQTGPIAFALAAAGHVDGIVKRLRITSNGVNEIAFPADWIVYVNGWEGATAGTLEAGTYSVWMVYIGGDVEVNIPGAVGVATATNASPSITLNGANPYTMTAGGTYTEPGYTATDAEDGDITANVVVTGTVNTATAGTYTKTYTVTDAGGLQATATRTVQVNAASNTTPAAPTAFVVDDAANTGNWTNNPNHTALSDYEQTMDGGTTVATVTAKPITGITGAKAAGQVGVRVKAATGRNASAWLFNATPYTVASTSTGTPADVSPLMWQEARAIDIANTSQVEIKNGLPYVRNWLGVPPTTRNLNVQTTANDYLVVNGGTNAAYVKGGDPINVLNAGSIDTFYSTSFEHTFVVDRWTSETSGVLAEAASNANLDDFYSVTFNTRTGSTMARVKQGTNDIFIHAPGDDVPWAAGRAILQILIDWENDIVRIWINGVERTVTNPSLTSYNPATWVPGKLFVLGRSSHVVNKTGFKGNMLAHMVTRKLTDAERTSNYNYFTYAL